MPNSECTRNCWIAGAVLGLFVWLLTSGVGQMRWFEGLFLAIIGAILMAAFLVWALCKGRGADADHGADRHRARASAAGSGTQGTTVSGGGATAAPKAISTPSGGREADGRTGAATRTAPSSSVGSNDPSARTSFQASARLEQTVVDTTGPTGKTAKTPDAVRTDPAPRSNADDGVPVLPTPPKPAPKKQPAAEAAETSGGHPSQVGGARDDLKQIRGVGPKLEGLLHDHGVTRFAQIAAWTDADIDQFADKIGSMGGRVRSDDWVSQARTLTAGGTTEISGRVDRDDL